MMTYDELRQALDAMAADLPGRPACQGCGYERNCQERGCKILREAAATMAALSRDCARCTTCAHKDRTFEEEPCSSCEGYICDVPSNWQWRGDANAIGERK